MSNNGATLKYKPDFERAQQYWDAFWAHEIIDRPCTIIRAEIANNPGRPFRLQPIMADFEKSFEQFDRYLQTHSFMGECMPGFRPGFGPDQMAGFLGAPIVISPDSSETSWSQKIVDDWQAFGPLKIDEDNKCWQRMIEFHEAAEKHFKGKCLLYEIDTHSNIDTLEGLRGAQKLLFDMIDYPDVIMEAMNQVRPIYKQIYEKFQVYGSKKQLGTSAELHLYSRARYNRIQADFICLLSPDMFRRFVLPALREEADYLDYSCFHLDGPDALKHLDDLLAIDSLDAIQWVPGAGAGDKEEVFKWPEVVHRIQAANKSIIIYGTAEEIKAVHGRFKPELLVYDVNTKSRDEGLKLLDWLKKNT